MSGTVRHRPDGSMEWRAEHPEAILPITVTIGGVAITVDALLPERPVELTAESGESLRRLTNGFALPSSFEELLGASDSEAVPDPILGDELVRLLTVAAVDVVHLGELDDGVLLLDAAHSRALVGDPMTDWYYALAASVPGRLVDEIESTDQLGPMVDRLAEVIAAAPTDSMPEDERREALSLLSARIDRADAVWDVFQVTSAGAELALASELGSISTVTMEVADLASLPARLLRFDGPEEPEIEVHENADGSIEISAAIRSSVDAESVTAEGIFAVAADRSSGEILAFAQAVAVDGRVVARIDDPDGFVEGARCAFLGADADLSALRLDPFGMSVARVDRHCRYAWTRYRAAGAIRAGLGVVDDESRIAAAAQMADAEQVGAAEAIDQARMLLRQMTRRWGDTDRSALVASYRDILVSLAARFSEPPPSDGAAGPTLAELHMIGRR